MTLLDLMDDIEEWPKQTDSIIKRIIRTIFSGVLLGSISFCIVTGIVFIVLGSILAIVTMLSNYPIIGIIITVSALLYAFTEDKK